MYRIKTDTHTHTIFSRHAYSTVEENARAASQMGLEALAITDHYSALFVPSTDFANYGNFMNMKVLPKQWYGVEMFYGAEADIVSMDGDLFGYDLFVPEPFSDGKVSYLEWLNKRTDFLIASIHKGVFAEGKSKTKITDMYCKVMDQDNLSILGHLGRDHHPFELKEVLLCAKAKNILIELNEVSFSNEEYMQRVGYELLEKAAEYGVKVSIGSDAHCAAKLGKMDHVISALEEVKFPLELIASRDLESFQPYVHKRI